MPTKLRNLPMAYLLILAFVGRITAIHAAPIDTNTAELVAKNSYLELTHKDKK